MKSETTVFGVTVVAFVLAVVALTGLVWFVQGNDFFMYKVFAPRYEQTRREVFEQSKAYRQGVVQEMESMRFQWEQADEGHKAALGDLVIRRVADFDMSAMSADMREWINRLREERSGKKGKEAWAR